MHWDQVVLKQVMGLMLIVLGKDALQMLNPDSPFESMEKTLTFLIFIKTEKQKILQ